MADVTIWNPGCEECGAQFLSGEGAPLDALGADGDFYLDTLTYDLYGPKASGVWPTPGVSLVGPAGPTGADGATGPQGVQGIPGPKGSQGLQGPTGATGAAGPAGADGIDGVNGSTIYGSSVDPVSTDGVTGDYWLNTVTGFLWGPKDATTNWVGTGFSLIGPTGATGATGPAGADGTPVDTHYGAQSVTVNATPIAFTAAVDPTLSTNSDYIQITGIFDALPSGELNGVTQQTNQLTVTRSGVYKIAMWATLSSDTNNSKLGFKFAVNGVISLGRRPGSNLDTAGSLHTVSAYGLHLFAAGDILTLHAACDKTAGITILDLVFSVNELNASEVNLLLAVMEEGTPVLNASQMNFVGAGVTVTDVSGVATVTIPGGGGGSLDVEEEGVSVDAAVTVMDFVGSGVTVTQTAAGEVEVNIPGAGASTLDIQDEGVSLTTAPTLLNFVGAGVTATEPVADQVVITIPGTNTTDLIVSDEGTPVVTTDEINFVGTGVVVTDVAGEATVAIPGLEVKDETVSLTTNALSIDFAGAGVTVTEPTADNILVTIPGGGGGSAAWTEHFRWDHSVSGDTAFPIQTTGITANEILVIINGVTKSISGSAQLHVSVDNGTTYHTTSGDYVTLASNGTETPTTNFLGVPTASAALRSHWAHIMNNGDGDVAKVADTSTTGTGAGIMFKASTADIDALSINNSAGGNATGGSIQVLVR